MKLLITILLSLVVFSVSFPNAVLMLDYQFNRNFYETNCVNRDKPEMECHGKCQIKKKNEQQQNPLYLVKYCVDFSFLPAVPQESASEYTPSVRAAAFLPFTNDNLLLKGFPEPQYDPPEH